MTKTLNPPPQLVPWARVLISPSPRAVSSRARTHPLGTPRAAPKLVLWASTHQAMPSVVSSGAQLSPLGTPRAWCLWPWWREEKELDTKKFKLLKREQTIIAFQTKNCQFRACCVCTALKLQIGLKCSKKIQNFESTSTAHPMSTSTHQPEPQGRKLTSSYSIPWDSQSSSKARPMRQYSLNWAHGCELRSSTQPLGDSQSVMLVAVVKRGERIRHKEIQIAQARTNHNSFSNKKLPI